MIEVVGNTRNKGIFIILGELAGEFNDIENRVDNIVVGFGSIVKIEITSGRVDILLKYFFYVLKNFFEFPRVQQLDDDDFIHLVESYDMGRCELPLVFLSL